MNAVYRHAGFGSVRQVNTSGLRPAMGPLQVLENTLDPNVQGLLGTRNGMGAGYTLKDYHASMVGNYSGDPPEKLFAVEFERKSKIMRRGDSAVPSRVQARDRTDKPKMLSPTTARSRHPYDFHSTASLWQVHELTGNRKPKEKDSRRSVALSQDLEDDCQGHCLSPKLSGMAAGSFHGRLSQVESISLKSSMTSGSSSSPDLSRGDIEKESGSIFHEDREVRERRGNVRENKAGAARVTGRTALFEVSVGDARLEALAFGLGATFARRRSSMARVPQRYTSPPRTGNIVPEPFHGCAASAGPLISRTPQHGATREAKSTRVVGKRAAASADARSRPRPSAGCIARPHRSTTRWDMSVPQVRTDGSPTSRAALHADPRRCRERARDPHPHPPQTHLDQLGPRQRRAGTIRGLPHAQQHPRPKELKLAQRSALVQRQSAFKRDNGADPAPLGPNLGRADDSDPTPPVRHAYATALAPAAEDIYPRSESEIPLPPSTPARRKQETRIRNGAQRSRRGQDPLGAGGVCVERKGEKSSLLRRDGTRAQLWRASKTTDAIPGLRPQRYRAQCVTAPWSVWYVSMTTRGLRLHVAHRDMRPERTARVTVLARTHSSTRTLSSSSLASWLPTILVIALPKSDSDIIVLPPSHFFPSEQRGAKENVFTWTHATTGSATAAAAGVIRRRWGNGIRCIHWVLSHGAMVH
ncbi:hypothetical protein B0H16DRAFT_1682978 [Mycena metata]|uniref:Uncharacterized protein n=1 Tax=Mycena metata TaxID=1033252 RepID=A0AAD7K718_9AGAR|nr:hypothetical protein B0H16DRAFT_1682978 [Mycena metata]